MKITVEMIKKAAAKVTPEQREAFIKEAAEKEKATKAEAEAAPIAEEAEKKFGHLGKVWAKGGKVRLYFVERAAEAICEKEGITLSNNKKRMLAYSVSRCYYDVIEDKIFAEFADTAKRLRNILN